MCHDTWLGGVEVHATPSPERLSTFLGKITRNLSLNRFKKICSRETGIWTNRTRVV